jgi:hypothetical protein
MAADKPGTHCSMLHTAMYGHFGPSTGGGLWGQQGMSSDIPAMAVACVAWADAAAASGAAMRPATTKIASTWRRMPSVFTAGTVSQAVF